MGYQPSPRILENYAMVLVNFALGGGKGLKKGEVVYLQSPTSALPLYTAIRKAIISAGGHMINGLYDDTSGLAKYFYAQATDEQLGKFFPMYFRGLVDEADHRIAILAKHDTHELDKADPKKIILAQKSTKLLMDWFTHKENAGRYTWTIALYGTPSMAKEAGLGEAEYWEQIVRTCYLDRPDPVTEWKRISRRLQKISTTLSDLKIERLHVRGPDADLWLKIGPNRRWLGGGGRNIPSFEVFTSPDWRGSEGWIRFNQPLYYYGPTVKGIELHFKNGRVVKSSAQQNHKLLQEMLATDKGAAQIGEFSLTDKRLSHITKFMAETLYDENLGGQYGNTHIAVGRSYLDTYAGDAGKLKAPSAKGLGFNNSAVHTDMISTADRTVTAFLSDGGQKVIYKKGQFKL